MATGGGDPVSLNTNRRAFLELIADLFFAILPLVILLIAYPAFGTNHRSLFSGPDISVVACVIFGLTLARMLRSGNSTIEDAGSPLRGLAMSVLGLMPIAGLVVSTLVICVVVTEVLLPWADTALQVLVLTLSAATHVVIGGYSIRSERV